MDRGLHIAGPQPSAVVADEAATPRPARDRRATGLRDRRLEVGLLTHRARVSDGLVTGTPGGAGQAGRVRAGALEGSGAGPARSMVDVIASLRAFAAGP